jgi:hypothetical protein
MPALDNTNDYGNMDAKSIAAEIGESLFARAEGASKAPDDGAESIIDAAPVSEVVVEPAAPVVNSATPVDAAVNPAIVPGQNSVARPLPKSWKKDMEPHWSKLSPEVHEYVHAREADVMRGIQQYQTGHNAWTEATKPYSAIFQQNPDVNPIGLFQGLMNTHLQLLNPSSSPQAKAQMAQKILADYGISLDGLAPFTPSQEAQHLQGEIQRLNARLQAQETSQKAREQAEYDAGVQSELKRIEAFANDAKNKYFNEVGTDILRFIKQGVATDIASAYDMACWANPVIREKLLADQRAAQNPPPAQQRGPNGKFINLDSDSSVTPRKAKPKTMDATIDAIVASHYNSAH